MKPEKPITLKELSEKYLELYDPRIPEENQCTGWHELKRLVLNGVELLTDDDLFSFHPNLRDALKRQWSSIRKAVV